MVNNWLKYIQPESKHSNCLLCQGASSRPGLCPQCYDDLPWIQEDEVCQRCSVPLPEGTMCGQCLKSPPHYESCLAGFYYVDPIQWMVKRLKFHGDLIHARELAQLMVKILPLREKYCRPDVLLPVPLHGSRLKERGYNQAYEIARIISARLNIPVDYQSAIRHRATVEQSSLPAKMRRKNMSNAFEIQRDFSTKHVVILDDVMTTGTTVNEFAKQLKMANAKRVDVWVCARS